MIINIIKVVDFGIAGLTSKFSVENVGAGFKKKINSIFFVIF